MQTVKEYSDDQDDNVRLAVNLLATAMHATVLAIVGSDANGVFVLPHPGVALKVVDYLATVDWQKFRTVASEHYVEP